MKRTLVLAVDRDDDYGVKGRVISPVIGIQNCISAANALGLADPEDSDINALYAAISTCMDLQEDGIDADVALICGNEKVGHRSDLAVVAQLEQVLDEIKPDNVVLVGDGAEDEYIYPIISSRSHVDSVKKVFVKQAPNIESSFYVISKMLSEPNKRKRFIAPLGILITVISLFLLIPDLVIGIMDNDISKLSAISRDLILLFVGIIILMYAYSFMQRVEDLSSFFKEDILSRSTRLVMTALAIGIVIISAIICYYELRDTYFQNLFQEIICFCLMMVWPVVIGLMVYIFGSIIDDVQEEAAFRVSNVFICVSLVSIGMVLTGLFDIALSFSHPAYDGMSGIAEIIIGIVITLVASVVKNKYRPDPVPE
ncbi:MAG: DUF373 family protein [Thermoplasmata archaeon]|nr:DUF373 family protein [Thermoplasmata archaeon]